jgi:hypothetical protein
MNGGLLLSVSSTREREEEKNENRHSAVRKKQLVWGFFCRKKSQ